MLRTLTERRLERLLRRIEELRAWRNARQVAIPDWRFTASDGLPHDLRLGDFWPVVDLPVTLTAEARVPDYWDGQPLEMELWLGGEGFVRLSTGLQASLNPMHHRFHVAERAVGGQTITIDVEAVPKGIFGSHIPEPRLDRAALVVPQRGARALERDLSTLMQVCEQLTGHEVVPFLLDAAEAALSELADGWPSDTPTVVSRYVLGYDDGLGAGKAAVPADWVPEAIDAARPTQATWSLPPAPRELEPLPPEAVAAVERARTVLAERLERIKRDYPPVGRLCLTGHAHIDLAWLWPLAETRRKIRRTFSSVLDLMDRYPDFTFNQSSAQAYAWIEEDDPAVFARIKARVAEGRWEPTGGMWLEPDCNVTGGEAFARHLIYGQRYFERTLGRRNRTAWLPDVFGFSGGMPQLLLGAGIDGFFTIKMYWNEATLFPQDLFQWEGIDGSRVLAHMFLNPGHGYNGNIAPLDTLGVWRNFRGKTEHPESLLAFGWGDGAGGPTEKMLESYARLKDFPAMPRLRMGGVEEFYAAVDREGLPSYVGELYFELHRGTLTTQARTKSLNRASEHRLVEAEAFGAIASLAGHAYPADEVEAAWKSLLLNQFHDVLPGSSIAEVYEDTHRLLGEVVATATRVRDDALTCLGGGPGHRLLVANPSLMPRPLAVMIPSGVLNGTTALSLGDGTPAATQAVEGGTLVAAANRVVPGLGWLILSTSAGDVGADKAHVVPDVVPDVAPALRGRLSGSTIEPVDTTTPHTSASAAPNGDVIILENGQLRVEIAPDGTITRLHDKANDREALADRANQLWAYVDKPRAWDAWDVDETHERDGEEIGGVVSLDIVETGPLRASVRIERAWRGSAIVQTYRLWTGSRRLDVETEIDWHERQVLLKARFPLAVHTHEATFETMFGVVRRPTHRNTAADAAMFEGSGHRFADLSEAGYGVALLNDGKYGHGVHGNVLTLSLLRSPLYPDPLADEGRHRFTYSLFPHAGDWTQANVTTEAHALNSPVVVSAAGADAIDAAAFVTIEGSVTELGLGTIKIALDGDGLVLRLYEPNGARGPVTLRLREPVSSVYRVNLLEEPVDGPPVGLNGGGSAVSFDIRPFEVVTLRLAR